MNANIHNFSVSVQANLRQQVKPRSGGHSQNESVARGMPI
jgi:hypothetical protein